MRFQRLRILLLIFANLLFSGFNGNCQGRDFGRRLLYVAAPGIRDYLEYGGHGILIFDIEHEHKFVRRFPSAGVDQNGKPLNVKGICASEQTGRLYVSTTRTLMCFDLTSDQLLWEIPYEGGCDRMAIAPNGEVIYLPSLEGPHWHAIDALTGDVLRKISLNSGAHNTIIGPEGKFAYLGGLKSPILKVADIRKHRVIRDIGPFGNFVRPFTLNADETLCYVNVNELLGFEIGDLRTGKVLHRIEIAGFEKGPVKRHGCPSHGIALTPDEKEIWVADSANKRVHIFSNATMPPQLKQSILLRDEPGWITFSIDGRFAYPSTGDVIETSTGKIVAELTDEKGSAVQSEKLLEVDFAGYLPVRVGNQFGMGRRSND